jgi:DNA-binding NarL/FixJ family response regulator
VAAALAVPLVAECGSIGEARARLPVARPTVSVIRAALCDGSGLELCRWLRTALPDHRALIVHDRGTRRSLMDAIEAGAAGFATATIGTAELRDAIARLDRGDSLLDGPSLARLATELRDGADARTGDQVDRFARLSERQRRIAAGIGDGGRNADIARDLGLAEQTVKNQVSQILATMGFDRRTQLAAFVAAQREHHAVETRR